jgi:hypothetical protein
MNTGNPRNPLNSPTPLTVPGLETVYDALATAIDQAGPEKTELFLVKLVLLAANAQGQPAQFQRQIESALRDL